MAVKELVSVVLKSLPPKPIGGQYGIVALQNAPVNALNLDVWTQLLAALTRLESDPSVRGLLLTSGLDRDIFTAGNDLLELYAPKTSAERYRQFWLNQTHFLSRLYRSRLVTVACIRGHAPAGGCCMALCCDYRIWTSDTPQARMGLNEVALGILVPQYWAQLLTQTVGGRGRADRLLLGGQMVGAEEAVQLNLVNEAVPKAQLMAVGEERIKELLSVPDLGRQLTKRHLREAFSEQWEAYAEQEAEMGFAALSSQPMIKALTKALERLGMKNKL